MLDRNKERLIHIIEAISSIKRYCRDKNVNDFLNDDLLQSAVLQKFLIIGEAVTALDKSITGKYKYRWHQPRSFRNFIAHEYFNIKPIRIWETIVNDLPLFEKLIRKILREEYGFVPDTNKR